MKVARHGCGVVWHQRGNQTAHCGSCHRTFSSERGFADHRKEGPVEGVRVCVDPESLKDREGRGRYIKYEDSAGAEVWRSAREDTRWSDSSVMMGLSPGTSTNTI